MDDLSRLDQPDQGGDPRRVQQERQRAPYYGGQASTDDAASISRYLRVLYKRRWTAITVFVVIVLSFLVRTFTAVPVYQARARLLMEENQNLVSFSEMIRDREGTPTYVQTQENLIRSRSVARRVLDELDLWNTPPVGGVSKAAGPNLDRPDGQSSKQASQALAEPKEILEPVERAAEPIESARQAQAIDRLLANLGVSQVRGSRMLDVTFRSPDPELAMRVVNAVVSNHIKQNLETKSLALKEAGNWLTDRVLEQRAEVEQADRALQGFREQNDGVVPEDQQNIVVQRLNDLNTAVTQAKTDRIQKESAYSQLRLLESDPALVDTIPAIFLNTFIRAAQTDLKELQRKYLEAAERLGDRHPEMVRLRMALEAAEAKLKEEIAKAVQAVRNEYDIALTKERSLTAALDQQKNEALALNKKGMEFALLRRDLESSRQVYDALLQRAKEAGVTVELNRSNIRLLDPAERPRSPISPNRRQDTLYGLLAGLVGALGIVFVFEYMDSRLKNPDEVREHLGVPSLALLPAVHSKRGDTTPPLINNGLPAAFGEAFRVLRTNLLFSSVSSAQKGCRTLTVTSTGPGEGKSIVSSNLAISLAQAAQRVLLIDADMRRPRAHELLHILQEPGLSNLLVGSSEASDCVRKTSVNGLWVLPAGHVPPNPAELLGSGRFTDLLKALREHFDWIILDTPPVMVVADATLVGHAAENVLFVVGTDMTSRRTAGHALEQLEIAKASVVGAVLNRVDFQRNSYYYRQYYRREYTKYYVDSARSAKIQHRPRDRAART